MSSKVDRRRNELLSIVNIDGKCFISDAAKLFGVTHETIRNDFDYLVKQHGLQRIHGGIKKNSHYSYQSNYDYQKKRAVRVEEKKRICYKMIEQIQDGDCLYIDGGSTVTYLLNYMNKVRNVTIMTPSVPLLMKFVMEGFEDVFKKQAHEMIFIGGKIDMTIQTSYGTFFNQMVSDINFDKMIFSCDAIDREGGITNADEIAYAIIKETSKRAKYKYLLVDKSKFDRLAKYRTLSLNQIDFVISDNKLDVPWTEQLIREGIFYIQA